MFKKIAIGAVVVIVLLIGFVAMQPSEVHVERSISIAATPEAIYPHINDLHQMNEWSPWDKMDPGMKRTYEGTTAGPGAVYSWAGNQNVGEGKMTITGGTPNETVEIRLEFFKPMQGVSPVKFTLKPEGSTTRVTWAMDSTNNFIGKAMCLAMGGMDKMVGTNFEDGLAKLKAIAEPNSAK